ncbi:hypothetical protein B0J12DRAFT_290938 [Macrophomina phaseolina]|uniref:Uncharacterized protein n=1 Tax=Macrophomina phaseolina TaxID=35725 RepID=A0ABQ8GRM5_9PEZI|nr:hypothetical protein B0J12DRAFT_290938 [Macrophomina phaseolina]
MGRQGIDWLLSVSVLIFQPRGLSPCVEWSLICIKTKNRCLAHLLSYQRSLHKVEEYWRLGGWGTLLYCMTTAKRLLSKKGSCSIQAALGLTGNLDSVCLLPCKAFTPHRAGGALPWQVKPSGSQHCGFLGREFHRLPACPYHQLIIRYTACSSSSATIDRRGTARTVGALATAGPEDSRIAITNPLVYHHSPLQELSTSKPPPSCSSCFKLTAQPAPIAIRFTSLRPSAKPSTGLLLEEVTRRRPSCVIGPITTAANLRLLSDPTLPQPEYQMLWLMANSAQGSSHSR